MHVQYVLELHQLCFGALLERGGKFGILLNFFKPGMFLMAKFTIHDNTDVLPAIGDDTRLKLT
jgi:hypothetical protein